MMVADARSMTATNETSGGAARTVDHVASGAHRAIDAVSGAARPAVDQVAEGIHHAVDRVAGRATRAAESLDAKGQQLRAAQARLGARCGARVRDKPMVSLAIAAGAGLLLGWLISRR